MLATSGVFAANSCADLQQFAACDDGNPDTTDDSCIAGICIGICPDISALENGACVCPFGMMLIDQVCACPPGASMVDGTCACADVATLIDGECVCPGGAALVDNVCQCVSPAVLVDGDCACPDISVNLNGICTCPEGASLIDGQCLCLDPHATMVDGSCHCPDASVLIDNACRCPDVSVIVDDACVCPDRSTLVDGVCVCPNTSTLVEGTCQCAQPQLLRNDVCECPDSSTLVNGSCMCQEFATLVGNTCVCADPFLRANDSCICPDRSFVDNDTCVCPGDLQLRRGRCRCLAPFVERENNTCGCPDTSTLIGSECVCPEPLTLVGNECIFIVTCPAQVAPELGILLDCANRSIGATCTAACVTPNTPYGDLVRTCGEDGQWSGIAPTCRVPNPCKSNPCSGESKCVVDKDVLSSYRCVCVPGAVGTPGPDGLGCITPSVYTVEGSVQLKVSDVSDVQFSLGEVKITVLGLAARIDGVSQIGGYLDSSIDASFTSLAQSLEMDRNQTAEETFAALSTQIAAQEPETSSTVVNDFQAQASNAASSDRADVSGKTSSMLKSANSFTTNSLATMSTQMATSATSGDIATLTSANQYKSTAQSSMSVYMSGTSAVPAYR
jgi:hypothetical protein